MPAPRRIHFITYGNHKFRWAKLRLTNSAKRLCVFNTVRSYGPSDLAPTFRSRLRPILREQRGGGYWLWKPYIIKHQLERINDGDILVYLDAGCTIDPRKGQRFHQYLEILDRSEHSILSFQLPDSMEQNWTVKECFSHFDIPADSPIRRTGQLISGILVMKKTKQLTQIINKWYQTAYYNPLIFTDHFNGHPQCSGFRENRHDQSVLSVILKKHGTVILADESYPEASGKHQVLGPFIASRKY